MKSVNYKLLLLGSSLLTGVVQAQEVELDYDVLDTPYPITFSPVTEFMDVACGGGERDVVYNLVNYEANTINLDSIKVITNSGDNSDVTTTFLSGGADNCIQDVTSGIGSGYITGYATGSGTCTLTLQVTPPTCPPTGGSPLFQTIDRELYIGIETRNQSELTTPIEAEVSVLGAGASFALMANFYSSTGTTVASSPTAQVTGNIGSSDTSTSGDFSFVTSGQLYNTQGAGIDTAYQAAVADLNAAYMQLPGMLPCQALNGLNGTTTIAPGCYELTVPPSSNPAYCGVSTVCVKDTNVLTGNENDNYYFFVPSATDLDVAANTVFEFTPTSGQPGTPANVFWIISSGTNDAGQVLIQAGAQFAGSVLSGSNALAATANPAIATTLNNSIRAQINGTLWSAAAPASSTPAIQLYGDTVAANN